MNHVDNSRMSRDSKTSQVSGDVCRVNAEVTRINMGHTHADADAEVIAHKRHGTASEWVPL